MSGTSWLWLNSGYRDPSEEGTSPFISLADYGYDVYIGNNRGAFVSNTHTSHAYDSEDFWSFTLDGYAEDVLANMRAAYAESGNKKGHYYGYSLGTTQMMIALSKYESELQTYLQKVIMMAPCMINAVGTPLSLESELAAAGVYEFFGPTWNVENIC